KYFIAVSNSMPFRNSILRLVSPGNAVDQAEGIGPAILHSENGGNGKDQHKPFQAAIVPQVHEEQNRQPGLNDGDDHHAHKHLGGTDVLICDNELYGGQNQEANVYSEVFAHSTALRRISGSHRASLLSLAILVRQIQKVDQWNHEHPNQINEVPVETGDFDVI